MERMIANGDFLGLSSYSCMCGEREREREREREIELYISVTLCGSEWTVFASEMYGTQWNAVTAVLDTGNPQGVQRENDISIDALPIHSPML